MPCETHERGKVALLSRERKATLPRPLDDVLPRTGGRFRPFPRRRRTSRFFTVHLGCLQPGAVPGVEDPPIRGKGPDALAGIDPRPGAQTLGTRGNPRIRVAAKCGRLSLCGVRPTSIAGELLVASAAFPLLVKGRRLVTCGARSHGICRKGAAHSSRIAGKGDLKTGEGAASGSMRPVKRQPTAYSVLSPWL